MTDEARTTKDGTALPLPVYIELEGQNGNAFAIIGRTTAAIRRQLRSLKWPPTEIHSLVEEYAADATSGNYDHILQTTMKWVHWDEVPEEEDEEEEEWLLDEEEDE